MSTPLRLYLLAVFAAAATLLTLSVPGDLQTRIYHYAGWAAICILSEALWLPTLSGTGTVTMASTAGLAAAVLWGTAPAVWIAAVSTVIAEMLLLRKPWVRALFNTSQITLTTWLACQAFVLLGGPARGIENSSGFEGGTRTALMLALPVLGLFVVYLVTNRSLVAVAVAWSTDRKYFRVLREDWFYMERLVEDAAAFLLSPLMVIAFRAVGYPGVVLFYAPLYMFHESHKRYLELRSTQNMLIHSERMAAKGEMAAEIGHELRNILSAISARAQMISKDSERGKFDNVPRNTQIILEQSRRMEVMSKGLMDFSRAELSIERVEINGLLQRTVELMRTQNRFDGVDWDFHLADVPPEVRADPGQLQQVFTNLFLNAADAMNDHASPVKRISITVRRDDRARTVEIVVDDSGPGIVASNLGRIFEPHFTTKATGHGFGLSTSYRIIEGHKGSIRVESPQGQGARFTITLPSDGSGGWS